MHRESHAAHGNKMMAFASDDDDDDGKLEFTMSIVSDSEEEDEPAATKVSDDTGTSSTKATESADIKPTKSAPEEKWWKITITVVAGRNLAIKDKSLFGQGSSDPYVKIHFLETQLCRTKTVMKSLNPVWNQTFTFFVMPMGLEAEKCGSIHFEMFDYDRCGGDDPMGDAFLPLADIFDSATHKKFLKLQTNENTDCTRTTYNVSGGVEVVVKMNVQKEVSAKDLESQGALGTWALLKGEDGKKPTLRRTIGVKDVRRSSFIGSFTLFPVPLTTKRQSQQICALNYGLEETIDCREVRPSDFAEDEESQNFMVLKLTVDFYGSEADRMLAEGSITKEEHDIMQKQMAGITEMGANSLKEASKKDLAEKVGADFFHSESDRLLALGYITKEEHARMKSQLKEIKQEASAD